LSTRPVLAVIPARGGSKGLPGKNTRPLAGLPLIAHSLRLAALCPEIDTCIVSTDSESIAEVARRFGANVPWLRPAELAEDHSPMWAVLQHALAETERRLQKQFGAVLLLQPTNPCRLPEDITTAVETLESDPEAVGVVSVSEPHFNPRWVCVEESQGYMKRLNAAGPAYVRPQDAPAVYRINGLLYLWRRRHVHESPEPGYYTKPHKMLVLPDLRAADVNNAEDLEQLELLLHAGMVTLPWLPASDLAAARQ
jgi:N-acylneuraminate cytidylyltransferase